MSTLDEAKAIFARASEAVDHGQFSKALDLFADLIVHPEVTAEMMRKLQWDMGICYAEMGDLDKAFAQVRAANMSEEDFREVLAERRVPTDPGQLELRRLYTKASGLVLAGRFQDALDAYAELLVHPDLSTDLSGPVHWDMALCYASLGDWEKADSHISSVGWSVEDFREQMAARGISSDAGTSDARQQYYDADQLVRDERYEEALDVFAGLSFHGSLGPEYMPSIFFNMAICHASLGRWDEARAAISAGHHDLAAFEVTMELRGAPAPPPEE